MSNISLWSEMFRGHSKTTLTKRGVKGVSGKSTLGHMAMGRYSTIAFR